MNIVYHCSLSFYKIAGVSMISVMENNKDMENINFYIIEKDFDDESKDILFSIVEKYGRSLEFIKMPDINEYEQLNLVSIKKKWSFDSYCRMFLDDLMPSGIDRVLYLDSDVICNGSLKELYQTNIGNNVIGGVTDWIGERYYRLFNLKPTSHYCNGGVWLIDLRKWRLMNFKEKVLNFIKEKRGYVFFMEQTTTNCVFEDYIYVLNPRYNVYSMMLYLSYKELERFRRCPSYYTRDEYDAASKSPILIHMTSSSLIINRPWIVGSNSPANKYFLKYFNISPWAREGLFPDQRDLKKKVIDSLLLICPRFIKLRVFSYVYNFIRTRQIKKRQKRII